MNEKKQINILDKSQKPSKLIFALVLPMIIEELFSILVNFVDTAMVGSIGVNATASTAVSSPVIMVCNGIAIGLGSGFGVVMSRKIGENRKDEALKTMQQSVLYMLGMGIFMTILFSFILADNLPRLMGAKEDIWESAGDYLRYFGYSRLFVCITFVSAGFLRGQGDTKDAMIGNIIANGANCIFNFLLIYETRVITVFGFSFTMWGAGRGVAGAAIATSIANVLQTIWVVFRLCTSKRLLINFRLGKLEKLNLNLYKYSFSLGWPNALERAVLGLGQLVTTSMLAKVSNAVVSAHSLAGTAESLIYMTVMGFGMSATTLVSQWLGAGDKEQAKLMGKYCIKYSAIVGCITTVILFFTCPFIIGIFTKDQEVIRMASLALRIQCSIEIIEAIASTISGILRGAGDALICAAAALAGMWLVRVPIAYIFVTKLNMGLLGVWIPMAIDWLVRAAIMGIRYKSGTWTEIWNKKIAK